MDKSDWAATSSASKSQFSPSFAIDGTESHTPHSEFFHVAGLQLDVGQIFNFKGLAYRVFGFTAMVPDQLWQAGHDSECDCPGQG